MVKQIGEMVLIKQAKTITTKHTEVAMNNENKKLFTAFRIVLQVFISVPLFLAFVTFAPKNGVLFVGFYFGSGVAFAYLFFAIQPYFYE